MNLQLLLLVLGVLLPATVPAQDVGLAFVCDNLTGSYFGAPTWKPDADGFTGQQVLVHFKGDKSLSDIAWLRDGKAFEEATGIGVSMKAGFAIVVLAEEYVDTYAYNAGTTELLYSKVRSGSSVLPNAINSYRGVCKPAGSMVR